MIGGDNLSVAVAIIFEIWSSVMLTNIILVIRTILEFLLISTFLPSSSFSLSHGNILPPSLVNNEQQKKVDFSQKSSKLRYGNLK